MKHQRPVNLNLMSIRFPIAAITSILHRISGAFLFLFIPLLLWSFQQSLTSADAFLSLKENLTSPFCKILAWALLSALVYHLLAGIRHLLLDMGIGEDKRMGKIGAQCLLVLAVIAAVGMGVWLW